MTAAAADLPVFVACGASHAPGAVPDPGSSAGTTRFLREDATWAVPASGGSGGSPGGSNSQIQYNSSGAFAGSVNLTTDGTNLTCGGNLISPKLTTGGSSVVVEQTGDQFGTTRVTVQNRQGCNGAALKMSAWLLSISSSSRQESRITRQYGLRGEGAISWATATIRPDTRQLQFAPAINAGIQAAVFGMSSVVLIPSTSPSGMTNPRVGVWQTNPQATLHVQTSAASRVATIIQGQTSQSVDLLQIRDSGNNILANVNSAGIYKGPMANAYAAKTTAYTATSADGLIPCNASGGAFAVTLMAANSVPSGFELVVKKTDSSANAVPVTAAGSDKIDGAATYAPVSSVQIRADRFGRLG